MTHKTRTEDPVHISVSEASFRDPSGFVFTHDNTLYRQVNTSYRDAYQALIRSGLYEWLVNKSMLIPHETVNGPVADEGRCWRIIRPAPIPFISYPYEWCFSQLKDAALLTLDIQRAAIEHGMCLKDASAYNIQFQNGRPVLIDTLSFERYTEGQPWMAYRQFCQHFLAPLALMAKADIRLNTLLTAFIDGIPLDLTSALLPRTTWFRAGLLMHLHLHAITQKKYAANPPSETGKTAKTRYISKTGYTGIVESLRKTVQKLDWQPGGTEWGDYYNDTNYSDNAFEEKKALVRQFLAQARPGDVWDLGANTGVFSRIATTMGTPTVSCDIDPAAVEINYRQVRQQQETLLLPLLLDLTNPSPGLGWDGNERDAFSRRGPADCIMALALIHHLSISNNVPFDKVARFFQTLCKHLIIEFIPKEDSQVRRLLSHRADIFQAYDRQHFEAAFAGYFTITQARQIRNSDRTLYLMQARGQ